MTGIEQADVEIAARAARHRRHPMLRAAGAAAEIADQPPLILLTGAWFAYGLLAGDRRARQGGGRALASVLAATALKALAKRLVSRTRPHVLLDDGHYAVEPLGPDHGPWHSFPSGHTAGAVAAARALARIYPEYRAPAYLGAAAVGLVQVPTAHHYPLDVAAGVLVGLAAEAGVDGALRASRRGRAGARTPPLSRAPVAPARGDRTPVPRPPQPSGEPAQP